MTPLDLAATQALQRQLANHLRAPQKMAPPPGLEERRLAVYRELLFNNIDHALSNAFPVLRSLLLDEHWIRLIRDFFAQHSASTPLFHQLAQEFLTYLASPSAAIPPDRPFFQELAHYEWVELALSVAEDSPNAIDTEQESDLLSASPQLSPLAWPLAYTFPVHRIGPNFQPREPGDTATYLVVYRNRSDAVQFMEINAVTARLLELIDEQQQRSGQALLEQIASEAGVSDSAPLIAAGGEMLRKLQQRGILTGVRATGADS